MNRRNLALVAAAAVAAAGGIVLARADPGPDQSDVGVPAVGASCSAGLDGAVTALPSQPGDPVNRKNLLRCTAGSWQTDNDEYPSSDRWLVSGPELVLHGQGVRNAEMFAGTWTGIPQTPEAVCTAVVRDATGGKIADPQTVTAGAGQRATFPASDWLYTVTLSGDCLWERS